MRLEGAIQRTNDDSFDCSSLYYYQPLSTFFSKQLDVLHVPTLYWVPYTKRRRELVSCHMMYAQRQLKLGPQLD